MEYQKSHPMQNSKLSIRNNSRLEACLCSRNFLACLPLKISYCYSKYRVFSCSNPPRWQSLFINTIPVLPGLRSLAIACLHYLCSGCLDRESSTQLSLSLVPRSKSLLTEEKDIPIHVLKGVLIVRAHARALRDEKTTPTDDEILPRQ